MKLQTWTLKTTRWKMIQKKIELQERWQIRKLLHLQRRKKSVWIIRNWTDAFSWKRERWGVERGGGQQSMHHFSWDSLLVERRTRDRKVASSNPGRNCGRNFVPRVNFVCWLSFGVRFTPVLRSFCQKRRWQVTPKHAYTLGPTKSEWADYTAVQA